MKNSNYNTRLHFESLLSLERERVVPTVNVRTAVRQALMQEQVFLEAQGVTEIIVGWFSGVRGMIATGLALASVLALALIAFNQVDSFLDNSVNDSDHVSDFIDSGDWSELL